MVGSAPAALRTRHAASRALALQLLPTLKTVPLFYIELMVKILTITGPEGGGTRFSSRAYTLSEMAYKGAFKALHVLYDVTLGAVLRSRGRYLDRQGPLACLDISCLDM